MSTVTEFKTFPLRYEKLYIAVRADLAPGLLAAQVAHGAFQFGQRFPELTARWMNRSNTLVIVAVPNDDELLSLRGRATEQGIPATFFYDPDLDPMSTVLTMAPGEKTAKLCRKYPLALQ